MLHDALTRTGNAIGLVVDQVAEVSVPLLLLGVLLHLASQAVRTRGWHTIIRASYPEATELRPVHTMRAFLAGSGINSVVPARGGDVVKLWLVHRRVKESRYSTLAATFVPETAFETLIGVGLVAWALSHGFLPVPIGTAELPQFDIAFVVSHPIIAASLLAVSVAIIAAVTGWLHRRVIDFASRLRQGLVILGTPRKFLTGVASWQLLSRVIRLFSIAALMGAFGLPVTVGTVLLVMAAQGGGRIIPLAPASAGLRMAMLSYGFVEITGQGVDIAAITAFTVGVGAALMVAGLAVALSCLAWELETRSPRVALSHARELVAQRRRRARTA